MNLGVWSSVVNGALANSAVAALASALQLSPYAVASLFGGAITIAGCAVGGTGYACATLYRIYQARRFLPTDVRAEAPCQAGESSSEYI